MDEPIVCSMPNKLSWTSWQHIKYNSLCYEFCVFILKVSLSLHSYMYLSIHLKISVNVFWAINFKSYFKDGLHGIYRTFVIGKYIYFINSFFSLQECTVISETKMVCPTPHIDVPGQFVNLTLDAPGARSKREVVSQVVEELQSHSRVRRSEQTKISEHEVSDERWVSVLPLIKFKLNLFYVILFLWCFVEFQIMWRVHCACTR